VLQTQMLYTSVTYGYIQESSYVYCFVELFLYEGNKLVISLHDCCNGISYYFEVT